MSLVRRVAMTLVSSLLTLLCLPSFSRLGFALRRRLFAWRVPPPDLASLRGAVVLVTGGNSGIGKEVCRHALLSGAQVHMLCRDPQRGQQAFQELLEEAGCREEEERLVLHQVDVGLQQSIREFVARFQERYGPMVDVLVNNASTFTQRRQETIEGIETVFATNVLGTYLLTTLLLPALEASKRGGRVTTVSSGGQLLCKMPAHDLQLRNQKFSSLTAYGFTKRAQVLLTERWAKEYPGVSFFSMHPGWVDTGLVQRGMPGFRRKLAQVLRSAYEGADTILFLASTESAKVLQSSGAFYFDRKPRRKHYWIARNNEKDAQMLWEECKALTDI